MCYTGKATEPWHLQGKQEHNKSAGNFNERTATVNPNYRRSAPLTDQAPDSTTKPTHKSTRITATNTTTTMHAHQVQLTRTAQLQTPPGTAGTCGAPSRGARHDVEPVVMLSHGRTANLRGGRRDDTHRVSCDCSHQLPVKCLREQILPIPQMPKDLPSANHTSELSSACRSSNSAR